MPSPNRTGLLATPCVTCREYHLKCDRETPRCGRCVRAGRECRISFKFKYNRGKQSLFQTNRESCILTPQQGASSSKTRNGFDHREDVTSPFHRLPSQGQVLRKLAVTYVDETPYLMVGNSLQENVSEQYFCSDDKFPVGYASYSPEMPASMHGDIRRSSQPDHSPAEMMSQGHTPENHTLYSGMDPLIADGQLRRHNEQHQSDPDPELFRTMQSSYRSPNQHALPHGTVLSLQPSETTVLPLKNRTEAILFRHYIEKIAVCLDCCDPLRHFELIVPERAGTRHTLLNAIFAVAARHLSHTTDFDPLASNRYHDECLKYLIPMMNHSSAIADENLFAATIILRMLEEMDGSLTGQDNYSHLLGIHAFVNAGDQHMVPGSLSAASFWVGLRQEIYIAILTQQRVKLNLDEFIVDRSLEPADDYTWSNRAIILLADILNSCFGDVPLTTQRWAALNDAVESWTRARPPSFNPFFYRDGMELGAFPEIWHGSSCHILGIQHHLLAQLFLVQFNPAIPRVGTTRREVTRQMTQRIEVLMRKLCGLGISNQWTPPAMFTACIGIAMFGDHFSQKNDQRALVELLRKTETAHARPTAAIQHQLMRAWASDAHD
ncbi:hypothetical protein GGS21DRAFT_537906 [Xylaria nigripes]|nr:hypothetical protein GGS21DRAFT_537906 [Xylaria nigripes]